MDAESFMDGMVAAIPDVFNHIDAWSSHPYPLGAFIAPPWEQDFGRNYLNDASNPAALPASNGVYNRGINAYEWEMLKLAQYGIDTRNLDIYITESGWRHNHNDPNQPGGYPTPAQVATYLDLAFHGNHGRYPELPESGWTPWNADPRVVAVTIFALDGTPNEWWHTNLLQMSSAGEITGVLVPFSPVHD